MVFHPTVAEPTIETHVGASERKHRSRIRIRPAAGDVTKEQRNSRAAALHGEATSRVANIAEREPING